MPSRVNTPAISRRRAIQISFCSSVALALNLRAGGAEVPVDREGIHCFAFGDFGTANAGQAAVAAAMRAHRERTGIRLHSMLLLGDNIYGRVRDGLAPTSRHWRDVFEDMYPAGDFACPCYAVLGNHDYSDNPGGETAQLEYARQPDTRWRMPAKWYRVDVGDGPVAFTLLALDSNLRRQTPEGRDQQQWLEDALASRRGRYTIVIGHHPVYSNGQHGDTGHLVDDWAPLFERHRVHAYLAGHDHDLQHLELADRFTSFVISGGGGQAARPLRRSDRPAPYGSDVRGFTHLHVGAEALAFSHHGVDGTLLHRFTKRADGRVQVGG